MRLIRKLLLHLTAWTALAVVVFPSSFEEVAANIGGEAHVVSHVISFLIGPATYAYRTGLVPGIDYFTQYSVGLPWLFSYFLGASGDEAMIRYSVLMAGAMYLYYLGTFYLLWWLYGSWRWSAGVTLTVFILQFHTDRPFFDPSSYVLRYPLLVATLALFAWWAAETRSWTRLAVLGACLGMSLFLNTETGVYQVLGVTAFAFIAGGPAWARSAHRTLLLAVLALAVFMGLCVAAFGGRTLSALFVERLFEPFFIYGGGYGAWSVDWGFGWQLLYNVVGPGVVLGTLGWSAVALTRQRAAIDAARVGVLGLLSAMAIMMSAKYWNMSIAALLYVNAFCFAAVMAWWANQLLRLYGHEPVKICGRTFRPARAVLALLVSGVAALLIFAGDRRNPSQYGLNAYVLYPSLINRALALSPKKCRTMDCAGRSIAQEDLELITRLTDEGERVSIFHWNDWAYLIATRRASSLTFLPSFSTFTRRQLQEALDGLRVVFVARSGPGQFKIDNQELGEALTPLLAREFQLMAEGRDLVAYARK